MKKSHRLSVRGELLSLNRERKMDKFLRANAVKRWRSDAFWELKAARIPHLDRVIVIVQPYQSKHVLADCGAHLPAAKAVIDALADAHVLDDDGPETVVSLTMLAPRRTEASLDRLEVELIESAG